LRLVEIWLEENNTAEALGHLERLRKQAPDNPVVMARLGQCRFLQGEWEEARQLLHAALAKRPDDPSLLLHLAKQEIQDGRPAEAEPLLRRAIKVEPSDTGALYTLYSCLKLQDRHQEANAVLELHKERKDLLKRANQLLQDEAQQPTKSPDAASEIGVLLLKVDQEKLGLYWLDQALARDPGHQATHKALAEYFENNGQPQMAALHRKGLNSSQGQKEGAGAGK